MSVYKYLFLIQLHSSTYTCVHKSSNGVAERQVCKFALALVFPFFPEHRKYIQINKLVVNELTLAYNAFSFKTQPFGNGLTFKILNSSPDLDAV